MFNSEYFARSKYGNRLAYLVTIVIIGLALSLRSVLAGWMPPSDTPPAGGVDSSFLTTDAFIQVKKGGLWLNSQGAVGSNGLIIEKGSVGIGTTSPSTQLAVYHGSSGPIISLGGNTGNYRGLKMENLAGAENWFVGANNSNQMVLRRNGSSDDLLIDASGNVGIGTEPTAKFHVNGNVRIQGSATISTPLGINSGGTGMSSVCSNGQVLVSNGTAWNCSTPAGGLGGSGTSGRIARFSAANTLDSSIMQDNGSTVGVAMSPDASYRLSVSGAIRATGQGNFGSTVFSEGLNAGTGPVRGANFHSTGAVHSNSHCSASGANCLVTNDANLASGIGVGASAPNLKANGTVLAIQICNTSGGSCSSVNSIASHISDVRWKKDMVTLDSSLEKIQKLRGVQYSFRADEFKEMEFEKDRQIGFIAQEVEKIYPELVETDKKGFKTLKYEKMTAILTEAVKELKKEKDEEIRKLEDRNEAIEKALCEISPENAICHGGK